MTRTTTSEPAAPQAKTLVVKVSEELRSQIAKGRYKTGDRLPSEAQMTQEFGVSRTVVREAISSNRVRAPVSSYWSPPRSNGGLSIMSIWPASPR